MHTQHKYSKIILVFLFSYNIDKLFCTVRSGNQRECIWDWEWCIWFWLLCSVLSFVDCLKSFDKNTNPFPCLPLVLVSCCLPSTPPCCPPSTPPASISENWKLGDVCINTIQDSHTFYRHRKKKVWKIGRPYKVEGFTYLCLRFCIFLFVLCSDD